MSESKMGRLIQFPQRPEQTAHLLQRLTDLDAEIEPLQREAEKIRRHLGLLGIVECVKEDGLED